MHDHETVPFIDSVNVACAETPVTYNYVLWRTGPVASKVVYLCRAEVKAFYHRGTSAKLCQMLEASSRRSNQYKLASQNLKFYRVFVSILQAKQQRLYMHVVCRV